MINRELIRIKVVQLTYAYYQNGNNNVETAEKELLFSLSKAFHLYNYLLALIVAVTKEARRIHEIELVRVHREGGDEPSTRFINNRFALQLEDNIQLREFLEAQKMNWDVDFDFVRELFHQIQQSSVYLEYLTSDVDSYEADKEVWRKLYKMFIQENDDIDAVLEGHSLYWNDDKETVDTFVIKTIKRFDPANGAEQALLPEYKDEEDRDFAIKLFRATIMNADTYQRYMADASLNWDFKRLAYMDIVLMQIALAEMMSFPGIPINVTINEYVDLAKLYSTPRSGGYINGMLDSIARYLIGHKKLFKPMPEKRNRENK